MQSLDSFVLYNTTIDFLWNVTTIWYDNRGGTNYTFAPPQEIVYPWWRQMIWTLLFVGMITVATGGNLIVIWIVLAHRRMRTVTNYFLVNLSIADTMMALNGIFGFIYLLNTHWPFGTFYCKFYQFIVILTLCASVFTLMAISIDRYMAIVNPLKPRMGKKATLCVIIVIWIIGTILSFPRLVFFYTRTNNYQNGEVRAFCHSDWPNKNDHGYSYDEYLYNIILMILTYCLPIGSMIFNYARVGMELWGSQSIGEATAGQLGNIQSKRRVVKMMIVVVVIFAVCWLPFHIYFILISYPLEMYESYFDDILLGVYWLALSNSMYNPIIYCWMNTRFRRGFAQVFFWCPWVRVSASEAVPVAFKGRNVQIQLHRTCTPENHGMAEIRASCPTGSTTPRSESESHLEDIESEQATHERHP